MVIIITKLNKRRAAIAYLYGPAITTSSASLLHKLNENRGEQFCCSSSLELKIYIFGAFSQEEASVK